MLGPFSDDELFEAADGIRTAVQRKLRSGCSNPESTLCRREIVYFWFSNQKLDWLGPKNFPVKFFPPGWDACMNVHGQGPRAHYLITFKPMIRRSPCTFLQYSSGSMTGGDRAARQFVSSTEKGID
eukprot:scpid81937/ scgid4148/ 